LLLHVMRVQQGLLLHVMRVQQGLLLHVMRVQQGASEPFSFSFLLYFNVSLSNVKEYVVLVKDSVQT
jgi:hypothetical protein